MLPTKSAARALLAIALPIAVFGSCSADTAVPTDPGPPPATLHKWSDPHSWPTQAIPVANQDVVVPPGESMILDVTPPALKSLTIAGTLTFADTDLTLSANYIAVQGGLQIGTEAHPYTHRAIITLTGDASNEPVLGLSSKALSVVSGATLELHGTPRTVWTRLTSTAAKGATQLAVEHSVDWKPGDNIVLASTDFDPTQAEPLVVQSASSNQVTVTTPLKWAHWGVLQMIAGVSLDERAEVGLLSRNITIRGDDGCVTDGYCGHIIVYQGGVAHVENVELYQMGQKSKLARYPFHWHVAGDVTGQYIRNSSIWHTENRCVTVHGTNMAVVSGNILLRSHRPRLLPRGRNRARQHDLEQPRHSRAHAGERAAGARVRSSSGDVLDHQSGEQLHGQRRGRLDGRGILDCAPAAPERTLGDRCRVAAPHCVHGVLQQQGPLQSLDRDEHR